jgi:hypothetical protein
VGNRNISFLETIKNRIGPSLIKTGGGDHPHHRDLATLDDVSPSIKFLPTNATWSARDNAWVITESVLKIEGRLEGKSAEGFAKFPGAMGVFVNDQQVWSTTKPESPFQVSFPLKQISPGIHYVAVNWGTDYGPLAASAFQIKILEPKKQ